MKTLYLILFIFLFSLSVQAASVETITIRSNAMNKDVKVLVVTPRSTDKASSVIYLLNGYSGNEKQWVTVKPNLPEIADKYNLIFVCPDGNNSWYWDSPKDPSFRYETFVSDELVNYIDTHYSTLKNRESRAITGLSMGGHGALWIAFRHTETFGAAGSTSGGVDIRPFPQNWEMSKLLGAMSENKQLWEDHTVINQVDKIKNGELSIIFDCGYDDFFFEVNNNFHTKLMENKIDHDYITRPGGHTGDYWNNSLDYQIVYFVKYFNNKR